MSYTLTANYGLYKPTPNADNDAWGGHLNTNADILDTLLGPGGTAPFLPLSGGTVHGGTSFIGSDVYTTASDFGTGTARTYAQTTVSGAIGPTAGSNAAPFTWRVLNTGVDGSTSAGLWQSSFIHNFTGTKGGLGGIRVIMAQTGPTADASGASFFANPLAAYLDLEYPPGAGSYGNAIAQASQVWMGAGAVGWALAEAQEIAITRAVGATVTSSSISTLIFQAGASATSGIDAAIAFSTVPGSGVGLKQLLLLGRGGDQFPLNSDGWILSAHPQVNNNPGNTQRKPQACAGGLDFWNVNFSTTALRAPGVAIGGNQLAVLGSAQLSTDASGLVIDAIGSLAFVTGIATPGAGYQVNDQLYDGIGGILLVSAVGGGGSITTANYIAGRDPYNFGSPPTSVTPSGGSGSGAVINIAWAARQQITLNKAGAPLVIGGITTGTAATFNTYTVGASGPQIVAGAGVPAATLPSGSIYLRTAGAAGARLYVTSGGGTWAAVGGV